MAQQQTENLNDVKSNEELAKSQHQQQSLQNGTDPATTNASSNRPPSRSNSSGPQLHHQQPPHHQPPHQQHHPQQQQQHPHHPAHHHLMQQQPPQHHLQSGHHMPPHPMAGRPPPMNDKNSTKSPPNQGGPPPQQGPPGSMMPAGAGGPPPPQSAGQQPPNNGDPQQQQQSHPYEPPPHVMQHYPPPHPSMPPQQQQQGGGPPGSGGPDNPNKDDPYGPPHPYARYHHPHDPNVGPDPYGRYGHPGMQPGGKPGIMPPNRPPQRYIPGQPPQGPTPTLNSLLQSHPPPPPHGPQHRYPNNYGDPQQQPPPGQAGQQQQQQQPPPPGPQQQQQSQQQSQPGQQQPPPPPQSYGPQQGWAPPPRPYSPQLGPSQAYRTPPPASSSRGQSPYPPSGQSPGSYPPSPQQGGPPPPSGQGPPVTSQYAPYPQRYPTPPGPGGGPNHRSPYPPHQYPEPNRPWPGAPSGPSPAASPGPTGQTAGGHPHPPASPHQQQHGGPTQSSSNSPGHAPSPSPQPPQPSPSPHQYPNRPSQASTPNTNTDIESGELIGQNSNDSSSCGGIGGMGSGPPGTPNSQQAMRPTPSPTGSSGSRSMSPAVGQPNLPMPPRPSSSSQPQTAGVNQLPPTGGGILSNNSNLVSTQQSHHHQSQLQQPPQHPHHHPQQQSQQQPLHPQHPQHHPAQQHLPPSHLHQQQQQHQQQQHQQQSQQQAHPPPQQQPLDPSSIAGPRSQTTTGTNSGGGGASAGGQQPPPQGTIPPHQQPQSQQPNQQPPPGSQQTAGGQGNNMAAQGSYQTPPPPISHMHAYKMGPSPGQGPGPGPQSMPPYPPPQSQQYSQGSYPPRPQYSSSYGPNPPAGQPPPASNMPPGPGQYPGRPMPNHVGGPHSQFPPYQTGGWTPPSPQGPGMMSNHVQGKGTPPPSQGQVAGSPRHQLNYLKQHLQHKGGYAGQQSPTPPQGYGNGPGMHPPMGPPHHMGPPLGPTSMGPPTTAPQSTPPPSVTPTGPNSHPDGSSTPDPNMSQDNGVSSSGSSTTSSHPVTSVVTTGPDGTPLDEASQQSTLSNASAASGEDPQCVTPKSRKHDPAYSQSHLAPPNASPGAHPQNEDFEMNSPSSWQRTAASPVFNSSHVPTETFRSASKVTKKKSDSLCKLYDMDDNPDRRTWLDKLLSFMEERRTPITACPTISKQPLDLYRLYLLVKERGGFVEVTKSKTWKDIAGLLGIGASSSAAYTLRKHYTKNLLAFECHFDRGDIDPLPIIQQVEAGSKKKQAKAVSVPSPVGSSNSQDSFPPPGSTGTSMDGYPGYPGNYPPGTQQDYNTPAPMQRPPSQNNAQAPHTGNTQQAAGDNISVNNPFDDPVGASRSPYPQGTNYPPVSRSQAGSPYQGQPGGYNQYGANEQYGPTAPPGQYPPAQGQFPPPNRTMYPPYEGDSNTPPPSSTYPPYGPQPPRPYNPPAGATQPPVPPAASTPNPPGAPGSYPPVPPQQDYYRQPEQMSKNSTSNSVNMSSQLARQLVAPMSPAKTSYHHNNSQPRRHPDFEKGTPPYPPYGQRPQMYGGWPNNTGQYRGQYPAQPGPQQWSSGQRPPVPPAPGQPSAVQWPDQHRYPPQNQQPYPPAAPNQQPAQWGNMGSPAAPTSQTSPLRPPQRSSGKPFSMPPPQATSAKPAPSQQPAPQQPGFQAPAAQQQKREIVFPTDSVEATTPVLYRRKRLARADVCPIDPWRIFMALKSGLLSESTWALDILNILLFDDTAVHYFGLTHLPGLLNLLMDHFQKNLSDMFDPDADGKHGYGWNCLTKEDDDTPPVDLGQITAPPSPEERVLILTSTPNYTMVSRKGIPVRIQTAEDDIFVSELSRKWDHDANKNYQLSTPIGSEPWTYGHMEPHPHDTIMDAFRAETVNIPFSRYIKSDKKDKNDEDDELFADGGVHDEDENGSEMKCDAVTRKLKGAYTFAYERKRKMAAKNGLTESSKRAKLKEWGVGASVAVHSNKNAGLDIKAEIKSEADETIVIKKEHIDSDCREVDMEIEPRIPNGPHPLESCPDEASSHDVKSKMDCKSGDDESAADTDDVKRERCDESEDKFDPKRTVRDPAAILKRRQMSDYEDECYTRDEASLYLVNESHDTLARRCICISNIFRNLTFVPGNETVLAKSATFLALIGKLLLLHHEHLVRTQKTRNYDREEDTDFSDSCSSLQGENEWWWDYLIQIRENMLVAVANIAGHLELSKYDEVITRPVVDGLLHWAVCPSAHGQDPFPSCGPNTSLSPQRLALEALCKLCVTDANVDLVIATPPFARLEKLCSVLTRHLCRNEEQVLREFSVNLLHYLAAADSSMSRTVALQSPCISYLVAFIEQAEQTALGVANQHGIDRLRENPDSMGTSLDMLRRAAGTLLHLARHPDNRPLFMQQEQRLLGLVMSHILDQQVALIISRVLFQVSRGGGPMTSNDFKYSQYRGSICEKQERQATTGRRKSGGGGGSGSDKESLKDCGLGLSGISNLTAMSPATNTATTIQTTTTATTTTVQGAETSNSNSSSNSGATNSISSFGSGIANFGGSEKHAHASSQQQQQQPQQKLQPTNFNNCSNSNSSSNCSNSSSSSSGSSNNSTSAAGIVSSFCGSGLVTAEGGGSSNNSSSGSGGNNNSTCLLGGATGDSNIISNSTMTTTTSTTTSSSSNANSNSSKNNLSTTTIGGAVVSSPPTESVSAAATTEMTEMTEMTATAATETTAATATTNSSSSSSSSSNSNNSNSTNATTAAVA